MEVYVHQFDGVSTLRALPLAAGLVVASARAELADARLTIRTAREDPDAVVAGWSAPDVLAFSSYVWNERYSLEVARRGKARWPGAFVVIGGPSVPRRPERAADLFAAHPWVDALVLGEGEVTFRELLRALHDGTPVDAVAGLALPTGLTAPRPRLVDFGATRSPYLDGSFDAQPQPGAAILETNRGCPFACTFCDWGQAVASRVTELPLERLLAELDWVGRRRIPYLYIVDANFGMRRRDLDLIRAVGAVKARTGFPQYVFFHLTKNATERHLDVVTALREAGIATHLALSAQDFEPRVLAAVKRENIRLERALDLRRVCHERGIPTFNELILGLPEQTYDSFAAGMVQAITPYPGDRFNLYLARMLENAEMASPGERARWGLLTRHVAISSFHHADVAHVPELEEVVVASRALSVADWRRAFGFGFFLAAAHNLRLLDVVLQVAWRAAGLDLRRFLEALLARLAAGPIGAVLDRYAGAVLAGEAMVLPAAETGAHLWAVEDAVALAALGGGDFYDEVEAFARAEAGPLVAEAVRWQRFVTPALGDARPRVASFEHDFAAWTDGPIPAAPATRRFAPAPALAAARDPRTFLLGYLSAVHARHPTGTVT